MITLSKANVALALVSAALVLWIVYTSIGNDTKENYDNLTNRIDSVVKQQSRLLEKISVLEKRFDNGAHAELTAGSAITNPGYIDEDDNLRGLEDKFAHLNQRISELEYEIGEISSNNLAGQTSNDRSTNVNLKERFEAALEQSHLEGVRQSERLLALQEELDQESVDQDWAQQAETDIEQAFSRPEMEAASLLGADCRTTLCEIRYTLDTDAGDAASLVSLELPVVLSKSFSHMRMAKDGYGNSDVHVVFARKR